MNREKSKLKNLVKKHRIDMKKIYLLFGEYSDHSGSKIPRAYFSKEHAERDLELINEVDPCSDLVWDIVEVPIVGDSTLEDKK